MEEWGGIEEAAEEGDDEERFMGPLRRLSRALLAASWDQNLKFNLETGGSLGRLSSLWLAGDGHS